MHHTDNTITARVIAVHKDRWQLHREQGDLYARLKTKEYYKGTELFPTVGDYVTVQYIENGDSQILATLPRKTVFIRALYPESRPLRQISTMYSFCSR